MTILTYIRLKILAAVDALRYSLAAREAAGWLMFFHAMLSRDLHLRGSRLARAIGFSSSEKLSSLCISQIHSKPGIKGAREVWSQIVLSLPRYRDLLREKPNLDRSIILKAPGENGEKGVLLMTFEYNWARLLLGLSNEELNWMDEHYHFVLSTSWSPTDYAVLALALSSIRGTVFVQSCNYSEVATIERFHPRLKCLPTLPCDWINPDLYAPIPQFERTTDIVMVANWGEFKRHWELFQALSKMPPSLKVVLIGQKEGGRTTDTLRSLAKEFGVPQVLNFIESVSIEEVARQQCNAKVSVIMTRREGCCVAAVESLFAGCALAMRKDAHVGPLAYINERTGLRLAPHMLSIDLMDLIQKADQLESREWARENISGMRSLQKVDAFFEEHARKTGEPWTHGILLPQWRPHPTFSRKEDLELMRPIYQGLYERFPKVFAIDLIANSWR